MLLAQDLRPDLADEGNAHILRSRQATKSTSASKTQDSKHIAYIQPPTRSFAMPDVPLTVEPGRHSDDADQVSTPTSKGRTEVHINAYVSNTPTHSSSVAVNSELSSAQDASSAPGTVSTPTPDETSLDAHVPPTFEPQSRARSRRTRPSSTLASSISASTASTDRSSLIEAERNTYLISHEYSSMGSASSSSHADNATSNADTSPRPIEHAGLPPLPLPVFPPAASHTYNANADTDVSLARSGGKGDCGAPSQPTSSISHPKGSQPSQDSLLPDDAPVTTVLALPLPPYTYEITTSAHTAQWLRCTLVPLSRALASPLVAVPLLCIASACVRLLSSLRATLVLSGALALVAVYIGLGPRFLFMCALLCVVLALPLLHAALVVAQKGLLALLPPSFLEPLSRALDRSLLDVTRLEWSGASCMDIITLLLFNVEPAHRAHVLARLPPSAQHFLSLRLWDLAPPSLRALLLPSAHPLLQEPVTASGGVSLPAQEQEELARLASCCGEADADVWPHFADALAAYARVRAQQSRPEEGNTTAADSPKGTVPEIAVLPSDAASKLPSPPGDSTSSDADLPLADRILRATGVSPAALAAHLRATEQARDLAATQLPPEASSPLSGTPCTSSGADNPCTPPRLRNTASPRGGGLQTLSLARAPSLSALGHPALARAHFLTPFRPHAHALMAAPCAPGPRFDPTKPLLFALAAYGSAHLRASLLAYLRAHSPLAIAIASRARAFMQQPWVRALQSAVASAAGDSEGEEESASASVSECSSDEEDDMTLGDAMIAHTGDNGDSDDEEEEDHAEDSHDNLASWPLLRVDTALALEEPTPQPSARAPISSGGPTTPSPAVPTPFGSPLRGFARSPFALRSLVRGGRGGRRDEGCCVESRDVTAQLPAHTQLRLGYVKAALGTALTLATVKLLLSAPARSALLSALRRGLDWGFTLATALALGRAILGQVRAPAPARRKKHAPVPSSLVLRWTRWAREWVQGPMARDAMALMLLSAWALRQMRHVQR